MPSILHPTMPTNPTTDAAPAVNPLVVIPARMGSSRLPGKPLALLLGEPMIVHVWRRAVEADVGPVIVAADHRLVAEAVTAAGGRVVMTPTELASGTDRVHAALAQVDADGAHDAVLNLQGDLPTVPPAVLRLLLGALAAPGPDNGADMASLAAPLAAGELADQNVVKVISDANAMALDFSRAVGAGYEGKAFHHVGAYAYRRAALERFVGLPQGPREKLERLEQLRALAAGMTIRLAFVDTAPIGVDTAADLDRVRAQVAELNASQP